MQYRDISIHIFPGRDSDRPPQQVGSGSPDLALCFAGAGIYQLQSELQKRHWDLTAPRLGNQWTQEQLILSISNHQFLSIFGRYSFLGHNHMYSKIKS